MKSVYHSATRGTLFCILALLILLPGCWPKKEETKDEPAKAETTSSPDIVLATTDGKPLMTYQEFERYIDQLDEAQPGSKMFIMQDPQTEEQVLAAFVDQKLISEYWLKDKGILQTEEYQKGLEQCIEMCTMQLARQKFEEEAFKEFDISDAEIKKYYNENKKRFIKTSGGIKAQEVVFSDEKAANEFLSKAKAPGANFKELAATAGKEVNSLGEVTKESVDVDPGIKNKLTKLTKVPSVDLVKVGKEFHVINSTDKTDEEYQTLEEAKEFAKQIIMYEKFPQSVQEKIQQLKKQYKVSLNQDYFKEKEASLEKQFADLAAEDEGDDELDAPMNNQGAAANTLPSSA